MAFGIALGLAAAILAIKGTDTKSLVMALQAYGALVVPAVLGGLCGRSNGRAIWAGL